MVPSTRSPSYDVTAAERRQPRHPARRLAHRRSPGRVEADALGPQLDPRQRLGVKLGRFDRAAPPSTGARRRRSRGRSAPSPPATRSRGASATARVRSTAVTLHRDRPSALDFQLDLRGREKPCHGLRGSEPGHPLLSAVTAPHEPARGAQPVCRGIPTATVLSGNWSMTGPCAGSPTVVLPIDAATIDYLPFARSRSSSPGPKWQALFELPVAELPPLVPAGRRRRPPHLRRLRCGCCARTCPSSMDVYDRLVELAGGGDLAARMLALYDPPPYLSGMFSGGVASRPRRCWYATTTTRPIGSRA